MPSKVRRLNLPSQTTERQVCARAQSPYGTFSYTYPSLHDFDLFVRQVPPLSSQHRQHGDLPHHASETPRQMARCISISANNLADSYMKVDHLDEAATSILWALAIQERLDGKASMAIYCFNLAGIYYPRKQKDKVRDFSVRVAVDLYRAVGVQKMVQLIERG